MLQGRGLESVMRLPRRAQASDAPSRLPSGADRGSKPARAWPPPRETQEAPFGAEANNRGSSKRAIGWEKFQQLREPYVLPLPRIVHNISWAMQGNTVMHQSCAGTLAPEEPDEENGDRGPEVFLGTSTRWEPP